MTLFQAIILGAVQGLTEFLPISSSGHLNVFPWLFGWEKLSEGMDVALHIGTLLALVIFFFKDWVRLLYAGYRQVVKKKDSSDGRMFWYLVIATIPAGSLSLILDHIVKAILGENDDLEMLIIAFFLIVMGLILYIVDKKAKSTITEKKISCKQVVLVGISQALAAGLPGVSRSGITMTTARALNIKRESAARLSFLLSMPITFAAVIFDIPYFQFSLELIVGILVSFLVGIFVIKFLLNYLKKGDFKIFAIYRVIFGIIIITCALLK